VTVEALTDAMIREARQVFRDEIEELIGLAKDCNELLLYQKRTEAGLPQPSRVDGARQRICDAINARREAGRG
jgi:predicted Rdx family selenoprotein